MSFEQLLKFIDLQDKRLIEDSGGRHVNDKEKRALARAVKLSEEVGELSSEILGHTKDQRERKSRIFSNEGLSSEFADVVITTLLLAKSVDVDIKEALEKKIDKINKRYL